MSYQDDLILSMYNKGEAGLAMGHRPGELPPYVPPDKPSSPYEPGKSPAPSRDDKIVMEPPTGGGYTTTNGGIVDLMGRVFYNDNGIMRYDGTYDEGIHGEIIPGIGLDQANQSMQINQDVANITPKDFSPPPFRYMPHIRIPAIKDAEMKHFKNFIEAMGGDTKGLTKRNKSMKVYGS